MYQNITYMKWKDFFFYKTFSSKSKESYFFCILWFFFCTFAPHKCLGAILNLFLQILKKIYQFTLEFIKRVIQRNKIAIPMTLEFYADFFYALMIWMYTGKLIHVLNVYLYIWYICNFKSKILFTWEITTKRKQFHTTWER